MGATQADQLGSHSLVFNATDEAGNALSKDAKLDFTVALRDLYELNLNPGINLVSLPSDPASTNINDVITSSDNINLVFTYNPADPRGPWLFASRNERRRFVHWRLGDDRREPRLLHAGSIRRDA